MRRLGVVHAVNAVGKSRVEDRNDLRTRVCRRQIMLRLVHLGFLPSCSPPSLGLGPARPGRSQASGARLWHLGSAAPDWHDWQYHLLESPDAGL